MNSSYNYTNLDRLVRNADEGYEEYDYYTTEAMQSLVNSEPVDTKPGIEAILFTGNRLRSFFD